MKAIVWIDYSPEAFSIILGRKSDDDRTMEAKCFQHNDPEIYNLLGQDMFQGDVQDDELEDFLLEKGFFEKELSPHQWRRVVSQMVFSAAELLVKSAS